MEPFRVIELAPVGARKVIGHGRSRAGRPEAARIGGTRAAPGVVRVDLGASLGAGVEVARFGTGVVPVVCRARAGAATRADRRRRHGDIAKVGRRVSARVSP